MSLKFNPYIALAAAVVGAVAVDQVAKKAVKPTDPKAADTQKYVKIGVGAAALAASWFYGDKTTKALLLGLGVGGLATQAKVVQENLLVKADQKLFAPKA